MLTISPEKVFFVIVKAREFDAKDVVTDPSPGSNPSEDNDRAILEDHTDDPVVEELTSLINSLSEDEQIDLVLRQRQPDELPERTIAVEAAQGRQLRGVVDVGRNGFEVEAVCHLDQVLHDHDVVGSRAQAGDQLAIEPQLVEADASEVGERGALCAEGVECDVHAERARVAQHRPRVRDVVDQ